MASFLSDNEANRYVLIYGYLVYRSGFVIKLIILCRLHLDRKRKENVQLMCTTLDYLRIF